MSGTGSSQLTELEDTRDSTLLLPKTHVVLASSEPLLSPHSALVHEKEEGERLKSLLVRENITGITSITKRITAILQLEAKDSTDETKLELDTLLKVLDTYSKEHIRLTFEMVAPLLLSTGSLSKVSSHGKTDKTRPVKSCWKTHSSSSFY